MAILILMLWTVACGEPSTPPLASPRPEPPAPGPSEQVALPGPSSICARWLPAQEPDCFGDTVDAPTCQVVDERTVGGVRFVAAEIATGCMGVDSTTHVVALGEHGAPLVMATVFSGHGQDGDWVAAGAEAVEGGLLVLTGRVSDVLQDECTETIRQRELWTVCEGDGTRRCATITVSDTARCERHAECGACEPAASPTYELRARVDGGRIHLAPASGEVPANLQDLLGDLSWERLLSDARFRTPRVGPVSLPSLGGPR